MDWRLTKFNIIECQNLMYLPRQSVNQVYYDKCLIVEFIYLLWHGNFHILSSPNDLILLKIP